MLVRVGFHIDLPNSFPSSPSRTGSLTDESGTPILAADGGGGGGGPNHFDSDTRFTGPLNAFEFQGVHVETILANEPGAKINSLTLQFSIDWTSNPSATDGFVVVDGPVAIPEPSTFVLAALGLLGAWLLRLAAPAEDETLSRPGNSTVSRHERKTTVSDTRLLGHEICARNPHTFDGTGA